MKKTFRNPLIIVLAIIFSGIIALSAIKQTASDFEISKNLEIFIKLYKELNNNYVDEINPGQLIKTGIDEMLKSLDPYTNFIPESDIEDIRLMTTGQYGGIGALVQQRTDYVVISEPYEGFPAHKAGLKAGDEILEVNGESAKNKKVSDVSTILKGAPGTKVKLKINRPIENKQHIFEITREDVKIKNVAYSTVLDDNTAYIKLTSFTVGASQEVKSALLELKSKHNITSLIFDLRGNGGGLLNEAINIVNIFIPQNTLVVKTKGKLKDSNKEYLTMNTAVDTEIPIAILIDGHSASASEIVAGAIQDFDRGVIIGSQSFGKGLVQNIIPLNYNTRLKVTVAKYYIPSGRCIQSVDYSDKDTLTNKRKNAIDTNLTVFYTKNKRAVYDAGGIIPDISTEKEDAAQITISLITKHLFFDFATYYTNKYSEIGEALNFSITDDIYNQFVEYLKDKDYDYITETEKKLEDLQNIAKKEKYYDNIEDVYVQMLSKLTHNKEEDLNTFRKQISEVLGSELISRYYFQKGRIEFSLKHDKDIEKALSLLKDKTSYKNILLP